MNIVLGAGMAKGYYAGFGLNFVDPRFYGGWDGKLSACLNDVRACQAYCRDRWGKAQAFSEILLDKQATCAATEATYGRLAELAQPGDLVVLAHSHHGGRCPDKSGDEADGKDETLVLWDGQVLDDIHASWLARFRKGVRVLLLVDTCHSQSISRFAPSSGRVKAMPIEVSGVIGKLARPAADKDPTGIKAAVITLAACLDSQSAMDGEVNGAFTEALLKVLDGGKYKGNYDKLMRQVADSCADQSPVLYKAGKGAAAFVRQQPFVL